MFCPNCGTQIDENGAFCPNCGSAVQAETIDISSVLEKEEKPEKVKKTKKKLRIVIACVLAFAILVVGTIGGFKFFGSKNADIVGDVNYTAFTEGFTDVLITDEKSAIEAVGSVADLLGINDAEKELKSKLTNQVGEDKYYSLQQYYNDIPVYGKNVIVSADKDGNAIALTSNFTPIENDISIKPTVSQNEVDSSVKNYLGANDISVEEINEENLVIHIKDSECILAYWLTVNDYDTILVDANTAKILNYKSAFSYTAAEVCSQDGKEKTMAWQNDDGSYHLYNDEYKISVYDAKGKDALDENTDTETIYSANNIFDKNAIIFLDSLINSSAYYKNLGFKGFDKFYAAINDSFDNGNNARGGGYGKDVYYGVVAVGTNFDFNNKDTISHEVTHSITRTLVDWEGDDETGAINEAYSDIFGELIEASLSENNTPNWIHGQRNMINPHEYENAKYPYPSSVNDLKNARTYKLSNGEIRYSTTANKQGQDFSHFASTIISHSAYLMWNGIDGTQNQKIDENKLAELWYRALMLLHEDSDFSQCRNAVELSARIMTKNNTLTNEQYKCVASAFDKVGINRAAFTNKQRVSNKFTLSVLGANKSAVENFNLTIYKYENSHFDVYGNDISKLFWLPSEIKKVYEKENQKGKVELELESGIYDIYVTEITDNGEENTIITRVVVSKSSKLTSDQLTIYTDFMDVTTIILNEPTNEATEETLKSKLTAQTTKTIQAFTCDDFDNDGKKEAFAFVGDKDNDDAFGELFTGELWYINDNTVQQLKSYSTMMTNMYSKINYVVEFSDRKFLCLNNLCGNYSLSEIWSVVNGQPKECNISGYGQGTVTVEHNAVALINSAYDAVYDSSTNSYIGHTWKPYYYYWDESTKDFKEYGGVKITKEQFLNIKGASDIINTILNGGNEIVNILYRENGMININYKKDNTYDNANLLYNEKTNTMEVLKSGFTTPRDTLASSYGGTYQEEIIESIATYPKKLPEIFNNTSSKPTESTTNSTTQNRPETPKYPLEGEYDEVLAKGDGYYLVSKFEESYDSAATLYGVVSDAGTWVCPLSANNEFAKAANNIQDGYSQSYHKIKYDYLGDKIFVIKNCSIILGRETIPSGYWGVYESHGGCVMVDVNGKYINSGGYIITEFKDGYAFTECGNAGLVYRLDKNGNQTKVRYVDDYFGIPSEGLVCLSYIFYDIETLTPTIDLSEYDMVTKSKDLAFKNGELYFEFKNPAGTKYHVKIDTTGKFLYDPVKMD